MLMASAMIPAPSGPVLNILGAMPMPVAAAWSSESSLEYLYGAPWHKLFVETYRRHPSHCSFDHIWGCLCM